MRNRNRLPKLGLLIAATLSLACGCANVPRADGEAHAAAVQVYELNPFDGKPYNVVGRVWADSRRSAFWVPTYSTRDEAIASMQTEAARLDADALVNVICSDMRGSTWFRRNEPAFLCYGLAIQAR